ncbi:hypothetical protein KI387_001455, partial [Taxus chinensis]
GQASSMETLCGWILNNKCRDLDLPSSAVGNLEDGEIVPEDLVLVLVPSKLSSCQVGMGAAKGSSVGKRGRKSKKEVAQLEVDVRKKRILKFDLTELGK